MIPAIMAPPPVPGALIPANASSLECRHVLRGVNDFAVGHSSQCFSFVKDWVREEG